MTVATADMTPAPSGGRLPFPATQAGRWIIGSLVSAIVVADTIAMLWLWNHGGNLHPHDAGEALTSLDAALALRPDDVEALAARANALTSLGRHAEALTSLDKALARAPGNAELWNNRGALLLSAKRPSDAFTAFDRALALAPNHETEIGRAHV